MIEITEEEMKAKMEYFMALREKSVQDGMVLWDSDRINLEVQDSRGQLEPEEADLLESLREKERVSKEEA